MDSPLIKDGALSLTPQGLLQDAPDIVTQMTVTLSAYQCMYNALINSGLIEYLKGIPKGGFSTTAVTNIVTAAYTPILIAQNIISNFTVAVRSLTINTIFIKINAVDQFGNPITLNWTNP